MTDAEIIKGLEAFHHRILKTNLSYHIFESEMMAICEALDLINRQKAEIEKLQKENNLFADIGKMYSEIKAEAIKEFAERLKERICQENELYKACAKGILSKDYQQGYEEKNDNILQHIDNLVKEMAGDME